MKKSLEIQLTGKPLTTNVLHNHPLFFPNMYNNKGGVAMLWSRLTTLGDIHRKATVYNCLFGHWPAHSAQSADPMQTDTQKVNITIPDMMTHHSKCAIQNQFLWYQKPLLFGNMDTQ